MSSGFIGNRDKGNKLSSENNTSFVKNVTSRVTGLIPSTITKWFSSPSSSNANGSAPSAESTDSSTEDEAIESSVPIQPPAKRMRFNSPGKSTHYTPIVTKCSSTNTEAIEPLDIVQSQPGNNTFRRETNYVSTPPTGNESSISVYNLYGSASTINNSIDRKRKTLFIKSTNDSFNTSDKSSTSTVKDLSQPYFKPGLLGSPFYPGRTTYGGAASSYMNQPNIKHRKDTIVNESSNNDSITMSHSARRVMDLLENYSSPLVEAKRIPQYMGSPKNNSLNSSIESNTSNRKNFSYKTQELHVPRIATILRLKQKSRLMDTTNVARQIIASHSSSSDYSQYPMGQSSPQTESSEKRTSKIKSRLTRKNRGGQESKIANTVNLPEASLQIDYDNLPQFSFGTPGSSNALASSTLKTVSIEPQTDNKPVEMQKPNSNKDLTKSDESTPKDKFYKFSSPVGISNETSFASNTLPTFTFGSPERNLHKDSVTATLMEKKKQSENTVPVSISSSCSNNTSKNVYGNQNSKDCSDESFKENNNSEKCCVCNIVSSIKINDKCVDCDKKANKGDDLSAKECSEATKWKCDICWVNNNVSSNKCVCCGNIQPKQLSNEIQNSNIIDKSIDSTKWQCSDCSVKNDTGSEKCICCGSDKANILSSGKKQQNNMNVIRDSQDNKYDWKCEDCWIKNKMSVDKCAACGGARPGHKISNSSSSLQVINDTNVTAANTVSGAPIKEIIKSKTDMWECSICLVRNENNRSKCVCCEADKPGSKKELEKKGFSFGTTPNVSFKFGIDPKEIVTECKSSEKKVTEENAPPKESETNNNVLPKLPSFTFGIPAKKQEDKSATENKQQEPSKISFTFGLPNKNPTQEEVTKGVLQPKAFSLLENPIEDSSKNIFKKDDKESNVSNIEYLSSKLPEAPTVPVNLFVLPLTTQLTDNNTTNNTPPSTTSANVDNTDTASAVISTTNMTTVETKVTQSSFTFVPSINLFSSPTSTVSAARTSFTTQQAASPTVTISLFEKSDSNTLSQLIKNESTTTSLLFNPNSESVSTTAQSSLTPAPPIFSFGNNQQSAVTKAEKQPYSFTFGSNKSKTNLFKNTFGTTTDSNVSAHKFTLPVTSSLGSSESQPGTTLGVTAGNATPSNVLSGSTTLGTGNAVGSSNLPPSIINTGNSSSTSTSLPVVPASGMFSTPVQKESIWSANNNTSSNLFVTNANIMQKPATFTFGATTTFNATTSAFGTSGTPAAAAQQTQNLFAMTKQNNNSQPQTSLFTNPIQSPPAPTNMFGAPSLANNTTSSMGLFGTPNVGSPSTFGTSNPSLPGFEAPSITQAPPAFNFGSQQSTTVFGFPQQQQQQQQQQQHQQQPQSQQQQPQPGSLYSFGAAAGSSPQVQFNMGSAPNTSVRRVRKAIRRTTQR